MNSRRLDAARKPHILPKYIIYGFFVIGLVSAIAVRAIIVFQRLEPSWVMPVWYAGIIGYIVFFLYRYMITKKRKKAIDDFRLIDKVKANACLTEEDRETVLYLLSSIKSSPEDLNYAIIFILSILAILADTLLSTLR
ncbi:MAG: hypothetical protein QMD07_07865 [Thermodesulfovibrionales bacterium]|nr:hypothetical protein [Thermodesulfovibrionales bacterium]